MNAHNPNIKKLGHCVKMQILTECDDLQNIKIPYLFENSTKTMNQMLKLRNVIVFVKLHAHFETDARNTFQKS